MNNDKEPGDDEQVTAVARLPAWLLRARDTIGVDDLVGADMAPLPVQWFPRIAELLHTDFLVLWSGRCVAHWLRSVGHEPPKCWWLIGSWLDWGVQSLVPAIGAVVAVTSLDGHYVGLVRDIDRQGRLIILAGREGQRVSMSSVHPVRVLAFRWPIGEEAMLSAHQRHAADEER